MSRVLKKAPTGPIVMPKIYGVTILDEPTNSPLTDMASFCKGMPS